MLPALRDDALTSDGDGDGFALRLSLPWIRSLPLASLLDLAIAVDGEPVDDLRVRLGEREAAADALGDERGWWYLQDRLVVVGDRAVDGEHRVAVSYRLLVPYLPGGPDGPLVLPFRFDRELVAGSVEPWAGRDVA